MKQKHFILALVFVTFLSANKVTAQVDPLLGQISMFAGNFAPRGWALCDGQLLLIDQNQRLFSILGTTYGGDGRTTFALPDLRGRAPIHEGQGTSLSDKRLGQRGGAEQVILQVSNLPSHTHSLNASTATGTSNAPTGNVHADTSVFDKEYATTANTAMSGTAIGNTGGNIPVSIVQPYLTINYIIALQGVFPSRN
jgi:microcystin-dependent protein